MQQVQMTVTGPSLVAIAEAVNGMLSAQAATTPAQTAPKKRAAAPEPEVDELDMDAVQTSESDELSFDEVEETPAPKAAKPKAAKAPKLTDKDVNAACLAHAKANGRPATMKVLASQFKVKSISELKPAQYAEVIEALEV